MDKLIVTDTIPLSDDAKSCDRIEIMTMSNVLAEAIRRVNEEESLSSMFLD